jgi:hypothetical protein
VGTDQTQLDVLPVGLRLTAGAVAIAVGGQGGIRVVVQPEKVQAECALSGSRNDCRPWVGLASLLPDGPVISPAWADPASTPRLPPTSVSLSKAQS